MLVVRFRGNCALFLLPEQTSPFPVFPTYTAPEHPSNSPLPLMLDTIRVKELRATDFPCTPLPSMISRLNPALVTPADLIPLLIRLVLMLLSPRKPEDLIRG